MKKILGLMVMLLLTMLVSCSNNKNTIGYTDDVGNLFSEGLLAVQTEDDLWGYINPENEMKISATFSRAYSFSANGFAKVEKTGHIFNYIDKEGNYLLDKDYIYLSGFVGDISVFKENDKYGVLNEKGEILVETTHDFLSLTENPNLIKYKNDELYGFINSEGDIVLEAVYDKIYYFEKDSQLILVKQNGKNGLVSPEGEVVLDTIYDSILVSDSKNLATVKLDDKWGLVNSDGEFLLDIEYIAPIDFDHSKYATNMAAIITSENKLGYVNFEGKIVIEPIYFVNYGYYDYKTFSRGVQEIPLNDELAQIIINESGKELYRSSNNDVIIDYDDEIICLVNIGESYYKVVDYHGNVIIEDLDYTDFNKKPVILSLDDSDVIFVENSDTSFAMYDYEGNLLLDSFYNFGSMFMLFTNEIMAIKNETETMIGYINTKGQSITDIIFDFDKMSFYNGFIGNFKNDGYSVVIKDGLYGVINSNGELVIDCQYIDIFIYVY